MRLASAFLMLLLGAFNEASAADAPPNGGIDERLVGTWRLVGVETLRPNGDVIYPFYGRHPGGLLIYDRSGWMSVQIVSDPKPTLPAASSREGFAAAPLAERAGAADGYYAYYGRWAVDAAKSTVTHTIVQSFYPAEAGETGVRHFSLDDDRLTLLANAHEMSEDHQRRLVWQRVR